jgi:hypothetical protein
VVPFWERRCINLPLHLRFRAELILQNIGHFLHHKVNIGILILWPSNRSSRHSCGHTISRVWESINGAVVHEFWKPLTTYSSVAYCLLGLSYK